MAPRSAIILAAGNGSRMGSLTADRPKCMLEVGGQPLIARQVASLNACGIWDVTVVIGYRGAQIKACLGDQVRYVENLRYQETNSLYSLWLARERLARGALVLNSDVLAATALVERLLRSPAEDAVLIEPGHQLGPEEMKITLWLDLVVDLGKDLPAAEADGENVGIAKFGIDGARRLVACLEALIASGRERAWVPLAFRELARQWPLRAVLTGGLPWTEIDFAEDLDWAQREIAPAIAALEPWSVAA